MHPPLLMLVLVALLAGCHQIAGYEPAQAPDAAESADVIADGQPTVYDVMAADLGAPCEGASYPRCESDCAAIVCQNGYEEHIPCFLGCVGSEPIRCLHPSNIPLNFEGLEATVGNTAIQGGTVIFDTATGKIFTPGMIIRPAGEGVLKDIGFTVVHQPTTNMTDPPPLGVFVFGDLTIASGTTFKLIGRNAAVLLSSARVTIEGTIDVAADLAMPGPGGYAGGPPNGNGAGPCAGGKGQAELDVYSPPDIAGCSSGSGGGGHGAIGGEGGACSCPESSLSKSLNAGSAGSVCGTAELIPLMGGSSGAGGVDIFSDPPPLGAEASVPGKGGGGGGALQISARDAIEIRTGAMLSAGGGGGGQTQSGGGSGGGAGGAILLEAPTVSIASGVMLAANGGGGGAGDCS
ncbi:MAG: hypothetical protein JRH20_16380 [Deltaproteobacteria bacterium]|nr:hypothetical protein [Deltaproteobacteria bacterium]